LLLQEQNFLETQQKFLSTATVSLPREADKGTYCKTIWYYFKWQ